MSHEGAAARILKKLVRCRDCEYCIARQSKPDRLRENDCRQQPNLLFFADIPRLCKYYKKNKKTKYKG